MPTTLVGVGVCGRGSLTAPQQETARLASPCLNVLRAMSPTLLCGKGIAMAETRDVLNRDSVIAAARGVAQIVHASIPPDTGTRVASFYR
jgi:hypothetical protein